MSLKANLQNEVSHENPTRRGKRERKRMEGESNKNRKKEGSTKVK